MFPASILIARAAVAEQLVGACGGDPVIVERAAAPRRPRTRIRLAAALHHAADRLEPARPSPAR